MGPAPTRPKYFRSSSVYRSRRRQPWKAPDVRAGPRDQRSRGARAGEAEELHPQVVVDESDVEDVLQDVFYELLEAQRLMNPLRQAGAWMYRVARNRMTDLFRRRRAEAQRHTPSTAPPTEESHALEEVLLRARRTGGSLRPEAPARGAGRGPGRTAPGAADGLHRPRARGAELQELSEASGIP